MQVKKKGEPIKMITDREVAFITEAARRCLAETPAGNVPYLGLVPCKPTQSDSFQHTVEDFIESGDVGAIGTPILICRGSVFAERFDKEERARLHVLEDANTRGLQIAAEPAIIWLTMPLADLESQLKAAVAKSNAAA